MSKLIAYSGKLHTSVSPPTAKRKPHTSEHHGRSLEDPWHWLRDPGYPRVENEEILAYLHAENDYFDEVMSPHEKLRESLFQESKSRYVEEDWSVPVKDGAHLYQWRFAKGEEYRSWWRKPANGEGPWQCFLSEPELSEGHDYFRLGGWDVSQSGELLVWSVDTTGSERYRAFIRPISVGDSRELELPELMGTPFFAMDGDSLVYVVVNENWRPWQVRVHSLSGSKPDYCIFEEGDERFRVSAELTRSKQFIVISTGDHVTTESLVVPASSPCDSPRVISPRRRGCEYSIDHAHRRFYIRINDLHENFRVVSTPESATEPEHWCEEITASDSVYLRDIHAFDRWLVVSEQAEALDQINIWEYGGEGFRIEFPESVYAARLGDVPEFDATCVRVIYESLVTPQTVFDFSPQDQRLSALKTQEVPGYSADLYSTKRIWATAQDGRRIPVSLVWRKDRITNKAMHLYAYGAYGIGTRPGFSPSRVSLLDRGFSFAIAHVRGGDELGYGWYLQGKLENRCNAFNDFIDVARHLIDSGEAETGRIAISGGSAGGELVGAVINQAPQLWGAAVAHVPFVDVLNTMLDADLPLTPAEWDEWGNPIEDVEAYDLIASYSPYDRIEARNYPPLMVTAGLNDPRVTYWEPAKWVAKLRHLKTDTNVLLLKTNISAGHGGKSGRYERLKEVADEQAFMLLALDSTP